MYPNLNAEQARLKKTNTEMARMLNITAYTYGQKKIHGGFTAEEAKIICQFFGLRFEYLFHTEQTK